MNRFICLNETPLKVVNIFLEKGLETSPSHFVYDFSKKKFTDIILTDQIYLPDCLYFLRYWAICVLQFFVSLVLTSKNCKLPSLFNQAVSLQVKMRI